MLSPFIGRNYTLRSAVVIVKLPVRRRRFLLPFALEVDSCIPSPDIVFREGEFMVYKRYTPLIDGRITQTQITIQYRYRVDWQSIATFLIRSFKRAV